MLSKDQFQTICDYTRKFLAERGANWEHEWAKTFPRTAENRWQHTLNVLRNAEQILAGEGVDDDRVDIVRAACILHDISMFVCDHEVHGKVSAEISEKYLREQGYSEDFVTRVSHAIEEHGTDLGPLPPDEQGALFSWEGKVVLEADILDKLGASTITNSLLFLGKMDKLGFECRKELEEGHAMFRASFFKDYIWTKAGRRMAEQRFAFFQEFLRQLSDEVYEFSEPL